MKAVIVLSGLAGFVLFGPKLIHSHHVTHHHAIRVAPGVAAHMGNVGQSSCEFEEELTFDVGVGSGDVLRVYAGSGSLEVVGVDGLGQVRAVARACASHREFLEELDLTAEMEGSALVVRTHYPDFRGTGGWNNRYARLDLRMEVPGGMVADIQDSSGGIRVEGLGALTIQDGSGEIEAIDIAGAVEIDDSSGEVDLRNVTGDVVIDDGSGEINVIDMRGDLIIEDGSGEIDVEGVEGSVRVIRDGSGSIAVEDVSGDFIVERDGSGSIRHSGVSGRVDIPRKGR
jgi:hypothetical protein